MFALKEESMGRYATRMGDNVSLIGSWQAAYVWPSKELATQAHVGYEWLLGAKLRVVELPAVKL